MKRLQTMFNLGQAAPCAQSKVYAASHGEQEGREPPPPRLAKSNQQSYLSTIYLGGDMSDVRALLNSIASSIAVATGILLQRWTGLSLVQVCLYSAGAYLGAKICLMIAATILETQRAAHDRGDSDVPGHGGPIATGM